jgi:dTDP-4-dehydrorhamnose 3,5-epimerase
MSIEGAWVHTPTRFDDNRGHFQEVFKLSQIREQLGRGFEVKQVNQSSSEAGVIRGIHWSDVPPGQAKYISCPRGSLWDVVIDLRVGSPTFGQWDAQVLSADNGKSILISEGLGHAFLALENGTVASYLCSEVYRPGHEWGINPLDPDLEIPFDSMFGNFNNFILSAKDREAPSLAMALEMSILPRLTEN